MIGLLLGVPLGMLLAPRRRRPPPPAPLVDPRAVSGRACCGACATAQRRGEMEVGTTCTPCAKQSRIAGGEWLRNVMPLDLQAIDRLLVTMPADADPDEVTTYVLGSVYPRLPDGQVLEWRSLSSVDPWCLHVLHHRVRARVCAALTAIHDAECDRAWHEAGLPSVPTGTREDGVR